MSSAKSLPPTVMSRDELDESTLKEIAEACHVSSSDIEDTYSCTQLQISTMTESAMRTGANVFQFVFYLALSVDLDKFCAALEQVVSLNPILRTRLVECGLGFVQVVTREAHCTQRYRGGLDQYQCDYERRSLSFGELLFHSAITESRNLVLTMHHAVHDHASIPLLLRDVLQVYHGHPPDVHAEFKDFVAHCVNIDKPAAESFWAQRFKGIPTIFPRVDPGYIPHATYKEGRKIALSLDGDTVSLSRIPSFIEAAWAMTAGAYAGGESVAFGLVLSGRTSPAEGATTILGPTIALVPVQVNLQRNMTVEGILKEMTVARRQIQTHPALQYGISRIRTVSEAARIASGFQTLLNIRPSLSDPGESDELTYDHMVEPPGAFGLCLNCDLVDNAILVEAVSDPSVLDEGQLRRILQQFAYTLQWLTQSPLQTKLEKLQKLNPFDRSEVLQWNQSMPETVERCVHELFTAQAREHGAATAVEAPDGTASYRELDEMSDRLAHELRLKGVSTGNPIACIFEKSLWAIVALLAIMKAGGACVPIEKSDPTARKEAIISSANVKIIVTSAAEYENVVDLAPNVLIVSTTSISRLPYSSAQLDDGTISPGDLAYILFTSGSTGVPKGVMLEHRCLASSLRSLAQQLDWQPGCRVLQFAAHTWDISIGEIFGTLLFGCCLCIPSDEARKSSLANFIQTNKLNRAWLTPTVIRTMSPDEVPGLKSLLSIGEPVGAEVSKTWGQNLSLINGWGPCEASILSTVIELSPTSRYPESIGRPVTCATWIVNPRNPNELIPIGAVGEIIVEGPGVARGYLNDRIKTAVSFIPPPTWATSRERKVGRFYRTGDLAKYNSDGSICFIGRKDSQVKIRGQRFELGELESILVACGEVRDAFSTTKIHAGRTELVAVVCLDDPQLPRETVLQIPSGPHAETTAKRLRAVRDYVTFRLPSFMVPSAWFAVEQMPHTSSAKLDRVSINEWLKTKDLSSARAALDPRMPVTLTPPATTEERLMQSVWSAVLSVSPANIGRESSFLQLGGDSILAMQVASRCRKSGIETSVRALLRGESLAEIAQGSPVWNCRNYSVTESADIIDRNERPVLGVGQPDPAVLEAIKARHPGTSRSKTHFRSENIESIVPATDAQAVMLATGQADKTYRVLFTLESTTALDAARIRKACEQVVLHHSVLRTIFFQHGHTLYQVVLKCMPAEMIFEESVDHTLDDTLVDKTSLAHFHLSPGGESCYTLHLDIHHALYDAISLDLIFRDLDAAYSAMPLSGGPDFHSWVSHVEAIDKSVLKKFWSETLRGSSMPYLAPPPVGAIRGHPLDERVQILVPIRSMQTPLGTPSTVMKAAWALILSQALRTNDVVFGEVSANRYLMLPAVHQVRGPCINFLPTRARLDKRMTFASLITQLQEQTTAALPYHHLGFRSIIRECTTWPRWTRFSSALAYQNHRSLKSTLKIGRAECKLSNHGKPGESADVWVIATPGFQYLEIDLHFSPRTFPAEQIRWISNALLSVLEGVPSLLEQTLGKIELSLRSHLGSYKVPPAQVSMSSNLLNGHPPSPSVQARETVSRAWRELALLSGDQSEDVSMFDCGADVVTTLLLFECYRSYGYNLKTESIIQNPTRSMQAHLIDSTRID